MRDSKSLRPPRNVAAAHRAEPSGSLADHAVEIARELGAHVFPVRVEADPARPGKTLKRPLVKDWTNGAAKIEPREVRDLFAANPEATHAGIRTGGESRLLVVDLDGVEAQAWADDHRELLPPTRAQPTQREGGSHRYYKLPVGVELRNSASKLAPGIDTRASGGFAVDWSLDAPPNGAPIVAAPTELIEALTKPTTANGAKGSGADDRDGRIREGRRNDALFRMAAKLRRAGLDEAAIVAALLAHNASACDPPLPEAEVRTIAKSAGRYERGDPCDGTRGFKIEIRAGERARALRELAAAMPAIVGASELMVYAGRLAQPHIVERPGFNGELVEVLELNQLSARAVASFIDEHVGFTAWKSRAGMPYAARTDAPIELVATYLDRADLVAKIPTQVTAIAMTPILRGAKLITARGFDAGSGKWLLPPLGVKLPERLDRRAAEAALARLLEWLAEFPFADGRARACGVAMLMTAALRASLPHAPLFLVSKVEHGEGGSTLCTLASIVQTGRRPAVIAVDDERNGAGEIEKRVDAAQLAGAQTIVLDNFKTGATVNSTSLSTLVTEAEREVRVLGESRNVRCANTQLVLVNGRNLQLADDFMRRAVEVKLDSRMAAPDERQFKRPAILEEAARDRASILVDCFAIAACYSRQRTRAVVKNRAGFEPWCRTVAEPLRWLDLPDVAAIPRELRAADPELAMLGRLLPALEALCEALGATRGLTAAQMAQAAGGSPAGHPGALVGEVLAEATGARFFGGAAQIQPKAAGVFFGRVKGRVIDGRRLAHGGDTAAGARWLVEKLS